MSAPRGKDEAWVKRAVHSALAEAEVNCYAKLIGRQKFERLHVLAGVLLDDAANHGRLMSLDEAFRLAEVVKVTGK